MFGIITWKSNKEIAADIQNFFPLTSMSNLIKEPFTRLAISKFPTNLPSNYDYNVNSSKIIIVIFWVTLFIILSYQIIKKRDL